MDKKYERNTSLDIIRITALLCVISVHFFLNSEYYYYPVSGKRMFVMTVMRSAFMVCVPLFIVLTGYLMSEKIISKKYYLGIVKTLVIYILASIVCLMFKYWGDMGKEFSIKESIFSILNFTAADYSWYVEMYIGLYTMIPFLNILYHNIEGKKTKQVLLLTMITMTALPGIINVYNFDSLGWWKNPRVSYEYDSILPDWWAGIYPITYYFIGCYIKEFQVKMKRSKNVIYLIVWTLIIGVYNYYRSRGGNFVWGSWEKYGALPVLIETVLVFVLLLNIDYSKCSKKFKKICAMLSNCCFGAYLVSYIFDQIFYKKLNASVTIIPKRLNYFPVIVMAVFCCSILLSYCLNTIYRLIQNIMAYIFKRIARQNE